LAAAIATRGPERRLASDGATSVILQAPQAAHSTLRGCIKGLAMGSSYMQHLAPMISVLPMLRRRSVFGRDPGPFVALAFNCSHWCLYGLFGFVYTGDWQRLIMVYSNILGSLLGIFYTIVYRINCDSSAGRARWYFYLRLAALIAGVEAFVLLTWPARSVLVMLGCMSTSLSISVAVSPLLTLRTVLQTRSSASMPADLVIASLVSNLLWLACGAIVADGFLVVSSIVNICAGLVSLSFVVRFHPSTGWLFGEYAEKELEGPDGESLARSFLRAAAPEEENEMEDLSAGCRLDTS